MKGRSGSFKVEGFKELDKALEELPPAAAKGVLRRAGRAGLGPMDAAWRRRAPHDDWDLEQSGGVGSNINRRGYRRESDVEVFAGPGNNPQAVQQEFGNRNHPPQPFMRPAWEETREPALEIVKDELAVEIDKAAARARRKALKAKR